MYLIVAAKERQLLEEEEKNGFTSSNVKSYSMFLCFFSGQIWKASTPACVLLVLHDICSLECLFQFLCNVFSHEVFYWNVPGRNKHHFYCSE